jgi:phage gp45-like
MKHLLNKIVNSIKRSVVTNLGKDDEDIAHCQVTYFGKVSNIETIYPYGMIAKAPIGSIVLQYNVGANEANLAGIPYSQKCRFKGLKSGEVVFGNQVTGSYVKFLENGDIEIIGKNDVNLTVSKDLKIISKKITINASDNVTITTTKALNLNAKTETITIDDDLEINAKNLTANITDSLELNADSINIDSADFTMADGNAELQSLKLENLMPLYVVGTDTDKKLISTSTPVEDLEDAISYMVTSWPTPLTFIAGAVTVTTGYVIPTTTEESNWNSAYGWGNHAGLYLKLDQTAPETVINGKPNYAVGLNAGSGGSTLTIGNVTSGVGVQTPGTEGVDAPYFNDESHWQIKVWAYKTVGSYTVYSATPYVIDFYDNGLSDEWFWIAWSWSAVAGATGYKFQYVISWNNPYGIYLNAPTNSFTDDSYYVYVGVSSIVTPASPVQAYSLTSVTINDHADVKGNLAVGNLLSTRKISVAEPFSLGTSTINGMLSIETSRSFAGVYVRSGGGRNIALDVDDGSDALVLSVSGVDIIALLPYADGSVEIFKSIGGSIWLNLDSSISAPGGYIATNVDTGITFYNSTSIKDSGDDILVDAPNVTLTKALTLTPTDTAPATPLEGQMYVDNVSGNHLYIYLNGGWQLII